MVKPQKKGLTQQQYMLLHGVKSGLEDAVQKQLKEAGIAFGYETLTLHYVQPESKHKYRPDFVLPNGLIIETKGRWELDDRQKMALIKKQHPDIDIRLIFSNSKNKISKGSPTTYGMWADKLGIPYADKQIPNEWLK